MKNDDQVCLNVYSVVAYPYKFSHILREMKAILKTSLDIYFILPLFNCNNFFPEKFLLNLLKYP